MPLGYARRGWVAILLVALIAAMMPVAVGAAVPATQAPLPHSEPKLGRAPATDVVSVTLPLTVDTNGVNAYLARLYDPKSPDYHHFLTPADYTARFVDRTARQEVVAFLGSQGLTVHDPGVGSTITADAPAAQIERAFSVQLDTYQAATGRTFIAPDRTAALPAAIAPHVRSVLGLDTSQVLKPHIVPAPEPTTGAGGTGRVVPRTPSGCSGAVSAANQYAAYTPNQLATAYDFDALHNTGYNGQGQTVALFELADFVDANITTWKNCFASSTPVTRVPVDGGLAGDPNQYNGEDEVELDIETVLGLAPTLGQLLVYEAVNSDVGVVDEYQQIANTRSVSVVSTSWGLCEAENSTSDAEYPIFQQMATQGMTVFAASGDHGTNDCGTGALSVDDPASQPYVTGVGGTHLTINSGTNAYSSEHVWDDGQYNGWAGGGGLSSIYPRPSWQTGPNVINGYSNGNRQVPDVAANADNNSGYVVYALGSWGAYGGTSAAAPLWAAGTALVNQKLLANGSTRIGFGNPVWYTLLGRNSPPYHDVTVGNNCIVPSPCSPNLYPATAGYDMATGVGTPDFGALALALSPPTIRTITPALGPYTGGTTVTITGTNFRAGIAVKFGSVAATSVTVQDSGTLVVVSPPQVTPVPVYVTVQNTTDATATVGGQLFTYELPPRATGTPVRGGIGSNVIPSGAHASGAVVTTATPLPQPGRH